MKIRIDEGMGTLGEITGIGSHSIALADALKPFVDCELSDYSSLAKLPRITRKLAYIGMSNMCAFSSSYDIIHYHNFYVPMLHGRARKVTTVHDLAAYTHPETMPNVYRYYARKAITRSLQRADLVTTPSASVRQELLARFPSLSPSRVRYCTHGVRPVFLEHNSPARTELPEGIVASSYLLFVGTVEKRKNILFMLEQFIQAKREGAFPSGLEMLLVGRPGFGYESFRALIESRPDIHHIGWVSDHALVSLYRQCSAFVFPSICEGLGLPVIEAMTQGATVVASSIPTNCELHDRHNRQFLLFRLGQGAEFRDAVVSAISEAAGNHEERSYGDLRRYSYDAVAAAHMEVYEDLLARKTGGHA